LVLFIQLPRISQLVCSHWIPKKRFETKAVRAPNLELGARSSELGDRRPRLEWSLPAARPLIKWVEWLNSHAMSWPQWRTGNIWVSGRKRLGYQEDQACQGLTTAHHNLA